MRNNLGRFAPALAVGLTGLLALPALCCLTAALFGPPPASLDASKPQYTAVEVLGVRWERVAHIERYRVVVQTGFVEDRPGDAFEIESLGQAHHHDEQVLDHYETEHYTEQVPYQDTETYTDQESCGQDCTDLPESCHEVCTADDNGFATCHDVCSGGGQSCTTRYCDVTRTRTVTRYRSEPRTREVPVYRSEPRYAESFRWRVWRWGHDRDVTLEGDASEAPRWPTEAELAPPAPLGEGERERDQREERYRAVLQTWQGQRREEELDSLRDFQVIQDHRHWYMTSGGSGFERYKPVPEVTLRARRAGPRTTPPERS